MKVHQYKDILLECLVTLRHARTFVTSRQKMRPTGIELYDNLIVEVADALSAPEPVLPDVQRCTHGTVIVPGYVCLKCFREPDSAQETSPARCSCNDFPGADQFCMAHSTANR